MDDHDHWAKLPSWLTSEFLVKTHPELDYKAAECLMKKLKYGSSKINFSFDSVELDNLVKGDKCEELLLIKGNAFGLPLAYQSKSSYQLLNDKAFDAHNIHITFVHRNSQFSATDDERKLVMHYEGPLKKGGKKTHDKSQYPSEKFIAFMGSQDFQPFSVSLEKEPCLALTDSSSCLQGLETALKQERFQAAASYPLITVGNGFTNWHMDHLRMQTIATLAKFPRIADQDQGQKDTVLAGKIWIILLGKGGISRGKKLASTPLQREPEMADAPSSRSNRRKGEKRGRGEEEPEKDARNQEGKKEDGEAKSTADSHDLSSASAHGRTWTIELEDLEADTVNVVFQPEGTTLYLPSGCYHSVLTVFAPENRTEKDQMTLLLASCIFDPQDREGAKRAVHSLQHDKTGSDRTDSAILFSKIAELWKLESQKVPLKEIELAVKKELGMLKEPKNKSKLDNLAKANAAKKAKANAAKKAKNER
jgi:hypothetical protein